MMLFMKLCGFGKCCGVSFVDSMMIPVCHNLRRYAKRFSKDLRVWTVLIANSFFYLLQTTFSSSAISSLVVAQLVTKRQMVW